MLKYVSEELRNDKGIVLKAVKQDGELSPEYAKKQIEDENYKYKNEESRIEVANRIKGVINYIIENNRGKRIYICTHANALLSYFSKIGNAYHKDDKYIIDVCNKNIFEDFKGWGKHSPELFKLVFNEQNEIIEFENINW